MTPAPFKLPSPEELLRWVTDTDRQRAMAALHAQQPGAREFAALLSPAANELLEPMAQKAQALTRRHFGRTISLYVPLYLSNHCTGGCAYCGYAADRDQPRRRLEPHELAEELDAIKAMGFNDILLLTGERTPLADFEYLRQGVASAAQRFHNVTVEAFSMTRDEYHSLGQAGCTGITLYQETYDPDLYDQVHRWGEKQGYQNRIEAPERALAAGLRSVGMGVLLGLGDPLVDALSLFLHTEYLRRHFWRGGLSISFPRICLQEGDYQAAKPVTDRLLAQVIFAFRICLPELHLVLSTREPPPFRDGMAGVGISRMSTASRTTVGGYHADPGEDHGQFDVSDTRTVEQTCQALRQKGLEPVFKNWDSVFQD